MSTYMQDVFLFILLAVISNQFQILWSYTSLLFLCAFGSMQIEDTMFIATCAVKPKHMQCYTQIHMHLCTCSIVSYCMGS